MGGVFDGRSSSSSIDNRLCDVIAVRCYHAGTREWGKGALPRRLAMSSSTTVLTRNAVPEAKRGNS